MTASSFRDIDKLESDLWEAADNLRANSKLTSSDYFMPVLGVIFLPGMLAGHAAAATPTPPVSALPTGLATPSLPPFATATPLVTPQPTEAVTPAPTPEATPHLYTIKSSDNSLTAIAHRFGLTLRQLLDANPQITDPDHIKVGQVITIPEPAATPAPS